MSYYSNSNAHMAFPLYPQQGIPRNMNSLNTLLGSVPQLHQQYRSHLPQQLQTGPNASETQQQGTNGQNANAVTLTAETQDGGPKNGKNTDPQLDDEKLRKCERKNRPGQKFGAKKKLWVWTWFVQDLRDPNVAVCDYCGKIITRQPSDKGLPKKLSEHLKTHKLSRDLINTTRPVPVDGNGITYSPGGLLMPNYKNAYNTPSGGNGTSGSSSGNSGAGTTAMGNPQLNNMLQQSLQQNPTMAQNHPESEEMHQQKPAKYRRTANMMNSVQGGVGSVSVGGNGNSSRINSIGGVNSVSSVDDRLQLHPLNNHRRNATQQSSLNSPAGAQYGGRRFISPNFDNTPYSVQKFHRHLLAFLTENKLSVRLLKLHSFQQLIYDLRPDSITDLLELTDLYSSIMEVSRVDTDPSAQDGHQTSLAESSVVNTLAQNLSRGD